MILAGNLNSRWLPSESGGQRAIESWYDVNLLNNGPRQIADYLGTTFITRGHEQDHGTWIDHILHLGDQHNIEVLGAFNSQNSEWEGVTDHRPLWIHYATHLPTTDIPVRPQDLKPRIELPITDKRQVKDFQHKLESIISSIPYDGTDTQEAEQYLEQLTTYIVNTTEDINTQYRITDTRGCFKDGLSPVFLIHK